MTFATWVFRLAGASGLLILPPMYLTLGILFLAAFMKTASGPILERRS